jgi:hypothetical protein
MIEFLECRLLWTVHCNTTQRSFAVFELSGHCKRHDQLLKTDWSLAVQMIVRLRQLSAITADANQLLIFYLVQNHTPKTVGATDLNLPGNSLLRK